ncbi:toluene tolerance protein [Caulobacter segnis]|uniref:Toluene tolerance family protein n=2 Tax=Caulobacter segnis TaxID=88688 RepID=D5VLR3_CAUST|nr:ABC transporter substrate-binding protein [Caulobacter segnis]ADG11436.1 toluene tolerance family protein [Caulobacter segnis ATCC 21756]AVQ03101.1 toluene tolerance protein [Caulobacter segnis]
MSSNHPTFLGGWMLVLALTASSPAAAGLGDPAAERFVLVNAQRVMTVLAEDAKTPAARKPAFRAAIDQLADVPRITGFVLGKYGRTVTPDQRARFAAAYRDYVEGVYQKRLTEFGGRTVKVTGSTVRKPGDVIVDTVISGPKADDPVEVSWRVLDGGGAWKVVDVQFKGVWLAITQQQDFVSTIDNAGGDVDVLIAQLRKGAARTAARQ